MKKLMNELMSLKKYTYHIWEYRPSHSVLTLRGMREDRPRHNTHLVFANLLYLQMPASWTGDFSIASDTDYADLLGKVGVDIPDDESVLEMLKETYSLYTGDTSSITIYILGKLHAIEYNVEPIYE